MEANHERERNERKPKSDKSKTGGHSSKLDKSRWELRRIKQL